MSERNSGGKTSTDDAALQHTSPSSGSALREAAHSVNRFARPYVVTVVAAGCLVLATSIVDVWSLRPPAQWWALVALTLVSGWAVLKIPSVPVNFSISDVFTLTIAVMFGPAAGTVIVALDSLVISARLARAGLPLERILFNAAAPPAAMWVSAHVFFSASGIQPLHETPLGVEVVAPWLLLFAGLYFFLNTFAIAVAVALHQRANAFAIWRSHFQNLWVTFIGGALGAAFVVFALQLGGYGIVVLSLPIVLAAILHFAYRNATGRVEDQLKHLAEVNRLHLSTIEALAHAIDAKDGVTHDHIRRVQTTAIDLASRMGVDDALELRAIEAAALLHDVGKIAIPEHILNKPGKLTTAEFDRMKTHASIGADILEVVNFPYPVVPIVRHHHENWDGTGYPAGLKGTDIPIGARILAVVDCFDALTSDRPYRRALSVAETFHIIEARSGKVYDRAVVDAFREMKGVDPAEIAAAAPVFEAAPTSPELVASASRGIDEIQMAVQLGARLSRHTDDLWQTIADALRALPDVDTVAIFLVNDANELLIPVRTSGAHSRHIAGLSIAMGERTSGWVAAVGQPMINADAALDLFDIGAEALRSAAAVRHRGPQDETAVIALYSTRAHAFADVHVRLIEEAVSLAQSRASIAALTTQRPPHRLIRRVR
jgi:putative nucleotidyltransferase with HDIG domain